MKLRVSMLRRLVAVAMKPSDDWLANSRRSGLDLPEVGIDRGREGEAWRQRIFEIQADRGARRRRFQQRVAAGPLRCQIADGVRDELEALWRGGDRHGAELTERRHVAIG